MGSAIEWTEETWNPSVGCHKVSEGCRHCYAEAVHKARLSGKHGYPTFKPWGKLNAEHNVTMLPARLDQPFRWSKPRVIFVNSMSDMFHELLPLDFIAQVFAVMALTPRHTYQVLTKRPERMAEMLASPQFRERLWHHTFGADDQSEPWVRARVQMDGLRFRQVLDTYPLPNVWLGTSIELAKYVGRADYLRRTPAAVRFVSAEPLLGPLVRPGSGVGCSCGWPLDPCAPAHASGRCDRRDQEAPQLDLTGVDWLIVGGESGGKHRPIDQDWVRDLRDACLARPISRPGRRNPCMPTAFFLKQWGGSTPKAGGRELDGRTWDEYPVRPSGALVSA